MVNGIRAPLTHVKRAIYDVTRDLAARTVATRSCSRVCGRPDP